MASRTAVQAISRRKFIKLTVCSAATLLSGKVRADEPKQTITLKMFADFGCPHCQATFRAISPLLSTSKNINFELLPVLPADVTDESIKPAPIVRFFYACAKKVSYSDRLRVAAALFNGVQEKAELSTFDSIYQWVMLQGLSLDYEGLKNYYGKYGPRSDFEDALANFKYYGVVYVPYLVSEDKNGNKLNEWRWSGNDSSFIDSLENYIKEA